MACASDGRRTRWSGINSQNKGNVFKKVGGSERNPCGGNKCQGKKKWKEKRGGYNVSNGVWKKQLPILCHMTCSQAPLVCEKNYVLSWVLPGCYSWVQRLWEQILYRHRRRPATTTAAGSTKQLCSISSKKGPAERISADTKKCGYQNTVKSQLYTQRLNKFSTLSLPEYEGLSLSKGAFSICQNSVFGQPVVIRISLLNKTNHPDQSKPKHYAERR